MKLALVHDFLYVFGGAEMVLKELHSLHPEAPIYTAFAEDDVVAKHFPHADIRTTSLHKSWKRKINPLMLKSMPRAVEEHDLTDFDVVLSSSGAYSHGVITGPDTVHISYCHSPMRFAWDYHAEFAEERGFHSMWLKSWGFEQNMHSVRTWDAITAKRVDIWVANARTVQERIAKYYRAKAQIIYPPVDTDYYSPLELEREGYAFTVSRLTPTKRIDQMIEACHAAKVPLRIAGRGDRAPYEALAKKLGADVVFLGPISDEEKKTELAKAAYFLFPAEDDFGIAPVEAMAMGTPVIAYGKGGATETVVPGTSGLLYEEPTAAALAQALNKAKNQTFNLKQVRAQALKFSREQFRSDIQELVAAHA